MRLVICAAVVLWSLAAHAGSIVDGLSVTEFFARLEKRALELNDGGMQLTRIRCNTEQTSCSGLYGSGNSVTAEAPTKSAGIETVTVTMELAGETQDFWLTTEIVMDVIDPEFPSNAARADQILGSMSSNVATEFPGRTAIYRFDRLGESHRMVARAR
jgi:hypothetical protein